MNYPKLPPQFQLAPEIIRARSLGLPIVALESTVITHGLPSPENLSLARDMENQVRDESAVPATIAVLGGRVCVGLNDSQLADLASGTNLIKISSRDLGPAAARGQSGGTTVAATMAAAHPAGIRVFATGGIGGVHRQVSGDPSAAFDISADLEMLARIPMVVVCAGAKAILDLRATLEVLETLSVPVVGFQTNDFPAFYSRSSGLPASTRADSAEEVARIARAHWELGGQSAVLVVQPPPNEYALPGETVEEAVRQALEEAGKLKVRGQQVTPFLLGKVKELTAGRSLQANLALLLNNARLAAQIARFLAPGLPQA
jgi:pseudouridylate synthase